MCSNLRRYIRSMCSRNQIKIATSVQEEEERLCLLLSLFFLLKINCRGRRQSKPIFKFNCDFCFSARRQWNDSGVVELMHCWHPGVLANAKSITNGDFLFFLHQDRSTLLEGQSLRALLRGSRKGGREGSSQREVQTGERLDDSGHFATSAPAVVSCMFWFQQGRRNLAAVQGHDKHV